MLARGRDYGGVVGGDEVDGDDEGCEGGHGGEGY
jgi:hypothetical protein